jgi:ribosomal protein S14
VESSCERGNEPSGSIKMLGICRMAVQLVASSGTQLHIVS